MCLNPHYLDRDGHYIESNYRGKKGEMYQILAIVPCGTCSECRSLKSNNWVIRNTYESKSYDNIAFITLTYKDNPHFLIKKDLQDFFKRLRSYLSYNKLNSDIRYFACGEYGEKRGRPHYHIILYGFKDDNLKYLGLNKKGNMLFSSPIIEKCWSLGRSTYQVFSPYEIPYISLYTSPNETLKHCYVSSIEDTKNLIKQLKNDKQNPISRLNVIRTLEDAVNKRAAEREKFIAIKEFNLWSLSLGWKEFYKAYKVNDFYDFNEFIEDKQFSTPSSWVKKLANLGDIQAANEMFRRERIAYDKTGNLCLSFVKAKSNIDFFLSEKSKMIDYQSKFNLIEDFF